MVSRPTLSYSVIRWHLLQPVIRYAAIQMMDMMNTNVGCEPAQHKRQIVIGAT